MILFFLYRWRNWVLLINTTLFLVCFNIVSGTAAALINNDGIAGFIAVNILAAMFCFVVALAVMTILTGLLMLSGCFLRKGTMRLYSGKTARYYIGNKYVIRKTLANYNPELTITHVCNVHETGIMFVMSAPARHPNIIKLAYWYCANHESNGEQGFVTSDGKYVDRKVAKQIAIEANQLIPRHSNSSSLFSECVWES